MASVSESCPKTLPRAGDQDLMPEDRARLLAFILQKGLADLRPSPPLLSPGYSALLGKKLPRRPRAVLVDVYGTLLTTGLGEVTATEEKEAVLFASSPLEAPNQARLPPGSGFNFPEGFQGRLQELIAQDHEKSRALGIPWPEVDAVSIFMRLLGLEPKEAAMACIAWECLANPCAPMPGAAEFLRLCREAGLPLGIVSNAQFYTPLFIQAAFGADVFALGLQDSLSFWSYRTGRAKPDRFLYDQAARVLASQGIEVQEVLYVGNDALNDCAAAGETGFMTVLFAGDARSFRPRESSERVAATPPDSVVTSWPSLAQLVTLAVDITT